MESSQAVVECREVTKRFDDVVAVDSIDLDVRAGEVVALLGPSGCGKTTTLRLVAGFEDLDAGTIRLDGTLVAGDDTMVPPEKRRVGVVFQDYALFPHLTVAQNVGYGVRDRRARAERVGEMLDLVGLGSLPDRLPHELSGGQQQRVALARALAPRPRVLLMDEPFSSLDERLRDQVRADTIRFLRETQTTTIVVTHDPGEAMRIADRVVLLRDGRVAQSGTPEEIYAGPRSHFVAAFFSELNEIPGTCRSGRVETALGEFAAPALAPGGAARVCIRPEHVRVSAQPTALSGAVSGVTFLGDHQELDVEVAGLHIPLHLHVPPGQHLSRGQHVYLDLDPMNILVFPSASPSPLSTE